ncbi:hypothetical protein TQ32_09455 [Pyrococcus kukulkanii]|uniref:Uncharacterized protein n=2 Tax=Pyrococcus kukulkanii TaxID=1609559 RepID=A0A127BBQ0_9EURY|nr:hypothetical protein TQ32_09455 [Pyrococcus kukulkanii]
MRKLSIFIALVLVTSIVTSVVFATSELSLQENTKKNDFQVQEIPRDPVVTDTDKIGGDFDPWLDSAYAYISGKASQSNPPWLYNIEKWAIAYPNCYLVHTTGTPGTTAYFMAYIQAETTCGELYAEIHWIEARN